MASGHVRYQTAGTCTLSTTPVSSNYRNQLGGTFTYDGSGDLTYDGTNTLTYDAEGRIATSTASGSTTTYIYGADGQRIGKTKGGVETNYARSIDGSLLATYVGGTFNGYPQEMWVGGKHFGTVTGASSSYSVLSYNSSNQLSGVTPPGGSNTTQAVAGTVAPLLVSGFGGSVTVTASAPAVEMEAAPQLTDLLEQANGARDALAAEVGTSKATVTGAFNSETGQVTAAACGDGQCAEDVANGQLQGGATNFTKAIRPRTGNEVPICERCESTYGRDKFPPDTQFKSDTKPQ